MARQMFHVFASKRDPRNPDRTLEIPVGVAFRSDRSPVFRLRIDSIPLNWDGQVVVHTDDPVSELPDGPTPTAATLDD